MKLASVIIMCLVLSVGLSAQENGWHLKAADKENSVGISAEDLYSTLLKGKASSTVVVAVIDSGVDVEHEDLKDKIWVNKGEIPGNGIDDDNNGYVDDVNGWNFIGGANGDVNDETLEVTRLYAKYRYKYKNANPKLLSKSEKKEYENFLVYKEEVETAQKKAVESYDRYKETQSSISRGMDAMIEALGDKEVSLENISAIEPGDDDADLAMGKNVLLSQISQGEDVSDISAVKEAIVGELDGALKYFGGQKDFMYNPDFESRGIVGDNYADQTEKHYGNNSVEGPDAFHGTHVAGIIGASRNNDIGMDGVAENVLIMSVRTVPNGDERDKDVANAIRYAVDNGASIINMSFGKGYSWNEKIVEDAIKYAEKKDVLLVHAAGNSSQDNDSTDNFPNDNYQGKGFLFFKGKQKTYKNWLEIGALNYKNGEELSAPFSNYGSKNVDLFAPGMEIYSTTPDDNYKNAQGTSMAAPVVAGVAAVLRSYFPTLTAVQVKDILMSSVTKMNNMVIVPGTKDEKRSFSKLSVAGGVVNAKAAVKLAQITKGKKKIKKSNSKA